MREHCVGNRRYLHFAALAEAGLTHAYSTKPRDLSLRSGPDAADRAANRRQLALDLAIDPAHVTAAGQVHGTALSVVTAPRGGEVVPGVDALLTATAGVALMLFSADCPLVVLYAPHKHVLAAVHASWRCTVGGLLPATLDRLRTEFDVAPAELYAGIGPSAGPQHYEVGADVWEAAATLPERTACFHRRAGRLYFDLWQACRQQLEADGVAPECIETAGLCTIEHSDWFFSHRRAREPGRFALLAALS